MFCWSQDERTHLTGGQGMGVTMAGAGEHGIFRGTNNNLNLVKPDCRGGRA